jgi:hypothetical protein
VDEELDVPTTREEVTAWLQEAEDQIAARYVTELTKLVRQAANRYLDSIPPLVAAGGDPGAFDGVSAKLHVLSGMVAQDVATVHQTGAMTAWLRLLPSGVPSGLRYRMAESAQSDWAAVVNGNALDALQNASNRITGATDRVWADVQGKIEQGLRAGVAIPELKKQVVEVTHFSEFRAEMIARTETLNAYNAGVVDGANALPAQYRPVAKEWLATSDGRTRPDHADADGQLVEWNGKFQVGASLMDRPHANGAPAAEVVNCRCTMLVYYPGDRLPDGTIAGENGDLAQQAGELGMERAPLIPPMLTPQQEFMVKVGEHQRARLAKETRPAPATGEAAQRLAMAQQRKAAAEGLDIMGGSSHVVQKTSKSGRTFGSDEVLNVTAREHGIDGPPLVATHEEIDHLVEQGWVETFRGASPEAIESFMTGPYESGLGVYGNGYYTAVDQAGKFPGFENSSWVRRSDAIGTAESYAGYSGGQVARMAIDPSARIISEADLTAMVTEYISIHGKLIDAGHMAMAAGYDGILANGNAYLVLLNREVAVTAVM